MSSVTRVLFVCPTGERGGAEVTLYNVVMRLSRERFESIVVCLKDGPFVKELRDGEIQTVVLPISRLREVFDGVRVIRLLRKLIRREKIHIVFSWMSYGHIFGGLAAWLEGVPALWWEHALLTQWGLLEEIARRIPARVVVANSKASATARRLVLGDRRPVAVVYPGTDIRRFTPEAWAKEAVKARASVGLSDSDLVFGVIGRLQRWKGQHVFLEAAARVAEAHPSARFLIVGDTLFGLEPEYAGELREQARRLGIEGLVRFTGFRDDIPAILRGMDVLVHTSIQPEPFGLVITEAMAMQRAIIATDAGGPQETIVNGQNGILVPPGHVGALAEAMDRLARDPSLRGRLGKAGRPGVEQFSDVAMMAGLEEILGRIAHKLEVVPKRMLYVVASGEFGGAEIVACNLARNHDRQRFDPILLFLSDGPQRARMERLGITCHVLRAGRLRHLSSSARLILDIARLIRVQRIDLVHSALANVHILAGLAAWLTHTPAIWFQHGSPTALIDRLAGLVPAHWVLANHEITARLQRRVFPYRRRVAAVPIGIDLERYAPRTNGDAARQRFGLPLGVPVVGIVGRLQRWKGHLDLVYAAPAVLERFPETHFLVVGDTSFGLEPKFKQELRDTIRAKNLEGAFTLLGEIEDVPACLTAMDIVVAPFQNDLPLGLVVLEGMAMSRAVITTNSGGRDRIIQHKRTGLLIPPQDPSALALSIIQLLENPNERMSMGRAAAEQARRMFGFDQTARTVEAIYDQVFRGDRRKTSSH
jgi:glycosyltransferase involved in cell wall biosynthesis